LKQILKQEGKKLNAFVTKKLRESSYMRILFPKLGVKMEVVKSAKGKTRNIYRLEEMYSEQKSRKVARSRLSRDPGKCTRDASS
jgi:hypothetical protein